ncbi:MAG TPA: serine hydrolase [Vicinamibacteria bacterium]|nr:serine hydrolase [Vicinamibacteria bacterium]
MEDRRTLRLAALALAVLGLGLLDPRLAAAGEKEDVLWTRLRERLHEVEKRLDGVLGLSVKDLETGALIEVRPDEPFPIASSIKLAILYELYRQADAGRIDLAEATRPPRPRVKGAGILQWMGDEATLTWRDLAVLMIALSDNAATNLLIDRVGLLAVNARLDELGLPDTRLRRRMMDLEAARRGEENVGTPGELRRLIEALHAGRGLSPAAAADLRLVLAIPRESSFRRPLPEGVTVLDKSGELEAVRCVTAVVDLPGRPYAVSIETTFLRQDADGEEAIREISAVLFDTFDRLSRSSDLGRIISVR